MTELELAAYLDRNLDPMDRARVERHLVECRECREEVRQTEAAVFRARGPRRLAAAVAVVGAAAVFAILAFPGLVPRRGTAGQETLRTAGEVPRLAAIGPVNEVPGARVRFVWGREAAATMYRLTLTAAQGVPLWTASTADTVLALPDSVRLRARTSYYWMTDALLSDGTTRSTGLHEFRITP